MDMKLIGKNIASIRKDNGYTQETLAAKLGVSPQAVSKWETGAGLPEASLLIELANLYHMAIDEILRPNAAHYIISGFIDRNLATLDNALLDWIPRVSRWSPPNGLHMWYSFPAMIATALICIEAKEQGRNEITYTELNERFNDLMHITGMGYGFLWNTTEYSLIEELWHVNNIAEMVSQAMGYYGRDYLWLTPENTTPNEMRQLLKWSVSQGRPVVMEWAGGIPEFNIVTGYEDDGETLIGFTYCEECAAKTNELGMFVNPARWAENTSFRALIIGNKINPSITDRDTIEYALQTLNKNEADDKEFFLNHMLIAGDTALRAWLEACDTDANTIDFFKPVTSFGDGGIFRFFLDKNSIYTQHSIVPFYKKLGARNEKQIDNIAIQIDIAVGHIASERRSLSMFKEQDEKYAAACKAYIEKLIHHRENMRGWLNELLKVLPQNK